MHADQPSSITDLKLILGGKFLENGEILNGAPSVRSPASCGACLLVLGWLKAAEKTHST